MLKERMPVRVIKAFHVIREIENEHLLSEYAPWIDVALLDAATHQHQGGTGQTFAWEVIPPFLKACQREQLPLWIAGGIHEGNVHQLLSQYDVQGIDVSSGIESNGRKDVERMKNLVRMVKL
jgi:phosphoribosylanthranilate isomerase